MKELNDGGIIGGLRRLYRSYGYMQYFMSKFEEYDLYAKNKDFLISEGVITFNDTDGRLLALKPDVTLSIIKNGTDGEMQKVYYDENVYRVSGSTRSFREIRQLGLECIGEIDDYCICEVLELSLKTLAAISDNYILDISHSGIISAVLDTFNLDTVQRANVLKAIASKNMHELRDMIKGSEQAEKLIEIAKLYGTPNEVLPKLEKLLQGFNCGEALAQLKALCKAVDNKGINIDLSAEGALSYYNGIVFKGFIEGVPESVLSGGQYDPLLKKMKRKSGAIGFAVYLDSLERLWQNSDATELDAVLLYKKSDNMGEVCKAVAELRKASKNVAALTDVPKNVRYKQLFKLTENGVASVE